MSQASKSHNFYFLHGHEPQLDWLGALAERYFRDDPNTCFMKLRQLGELLAQEVATRVGLFASPDEAQSDLLRRLKVERAVPPAMDLFHQIRIAGNQAAHAHAGDHASALTTLKIARELAVWFHRTFSRQPNFKPGPFVPPSPPGEAEASLRQELAQLREELKARMSAEERARADAAAAVTVLSEFPAIIPVCRNPNDDHVLAAALAAQAGCVITGDRDLLDLGSYQGIHMRTVREALDDLGR